MQRCAAASLFAFVLLMVTPAAAKFDKDPEIRDGMVRGSVIIGHSVHPVAGGDEKRLLASPRLTIDYRALAELKIWLDVPTSHMSERHDEDAGLSTFEMANIALGARYVSRLSRTMVLRVGGGIVAPSATDLGRDKTNVFDLPLLAHTSTAKAHGLWQFWLYTPGFLSIVSDNRIVFRTGRFRLVANLDLAVMIRTEGGGGGGDDLRFAAQLEVKAGFRNKIIGTGVAVRAVAVPVGPVGQDQLQSSVAAFFRAFLSGGFFDVRFNINIDPPGGFSFADDRWWGLEIGLGAYL